MDYYKNISYFISHIFLFWFFYLFTIHRFSRKKTSCICICSVLALGVSDCLKLNVFPGNDLCFGNGLSDIGSAADQSLYFERQGRQGFVFRADRFQLCDSGKYRIFGSAYIDRTCHSVISGKYDSACLHPAFSVP